MDFALVPLIIEALQRHDLIEVQTHSVMTLSNLARIEEFALQIAAIGGCLSIAQLCHTLNEDLQTKVAKLVANLSCFELPRQLLLNHGAKKALEGKVRSSCRSLAQNAQIAINNLSVPIKTLNQQLTVSSEAAEKFFLKRIKIIDEILDTERTYCRHLEACITIYMVPLAAQQEKPLLSPKAIRDIFGEVEVIANLHRNFREDLESTLVRSRAGLRSNSVAEIYVGPAFLRLLDCLKLYKPYISNYDRSSNALSDALESPKFHSWAEKQHSTNETLSLANILITPIQRIPRYSLLLQELLKHMAMSHPDYENLDKALKGVLSIADYLEAERGKVEDTNKVVKIQEQLNNAPMKLVAPFRRFVFESDIIEEHLSATKPGSAMRIKMRHLFLFNDILIVAAPHRKRFDFRSVLSLNSVKAVPLTEANQSTTFRIVTTDSAHNFGCGSVSQRDEWVNQINDAVFQHKRNNYSYWYY